MIYWNIRRKPSSEGSSVTDMITTLGLDFGTPRYSQILVMQLEDKDRDRYMTLEQQ